MLELWPYIRILIVGLIWFTALFVHNRHSP